MRFRSDQNALFVLFLIVMAFTPLLVGSFGRINYAGDKTEALLEGQSLIEVSIAEKIVEEDGAILLVFSFDNVTVDIDVPGNLVSADIEKGDASAFLSGFIPYLPFLTFTDPPTINEGYIGNVKIQGIYTDFAKASNIQIFPENNPSDKYIFNLTGINVNGDEETANFNLNQLLKVSKNPYIASIEWNRIGVGTIRVKNRFYISRSDIVAVGSGQRIWVTPDSGIKWRERAILSATGELRGVTWVTPSLCIAVSSSNGSTMVWDVSGEPQISEPRASGLNSVAYGGGKYVAVCNSGKLLYAESDQDFLTGSLTTLEAADGKNLNAIAWGGDKFIAVGEDGTIIISSNGSVWASISPAAAEGFSLRGITYNDNTDKPKWVSAGGDSAGNAVIFYMINTADGWVKVNALPENAKTINDVIYGGGRYVAVGNHGTVLTSIDDGVTWEAIDVNVINTDLYAVDYGIGEDGISADYIIVGAAGTVRIASYGIDKSWTIKQGAGISQDIHGVAIRANE